MMRRLLVAIAIIVLFLLLLYPLAHAQQNHDQHHAFYKNWINKRDMGCCNNQDCGVLNQEDERNSPTGVEVRIDGKWCPVLPSHYLKKGNAPDWSSAHVCVQKVRSWNMSFDPCERLLCYQPRPGI